MHSTSLIALLVLIVGVSSQCFGGNCGGGCYGNNCGNRVTVVRVPNNNGCSCNSCYGNGCAPRCSYCPNNFGWNGYSSCCNNNNFSCCGYRYRRHAAETSETTSN
uniref:CC domain-containing protein n=1 Tax=Caenorhabditis tropicalis TaxID=1561998 RepID=A0A1I7UB76_9PELO